MDSEHSAMLAIGDFTGMLQAYLSHATRWVREPDPLGTVMMRQGLAAAALHLSCRPRDEDVGWTLNFTKPPMNIFLTGSSEDDQVTGRLFVNDVKTDEHSLLYVQSKRPHTELAQTVIEVRGLDLLKIFEDFYCQSEQQSARFFDFEDGRSAMVVGLPGLDEEWLKDLNRERVGAIVDAKSLKLIESRQFHFACGCTAEKLKAALRTSFKDLDEIFEGDPSLESQCPRCGHNWIIQRSDMDQ